MTLISRITSLKHPGVLRDFTWPSDLPTFGRFNLIYGWNGSGKTTISNLFRALEMRAAPANGEVVFSINGRNVRGDKFKQEMIPVRVFNRDFVSENVFPVDGDDIPLIFVLGKETIEKQKQLDLAKGNLVGAETALQSAKEKQRDAERVLDKHCFDRATVIRDTLRSSGKNEYNNYDRTNYKQRAQQMTDAGDQNDHLLEETDRERFLAQHRATEKPKLQRVSYALPNLATHATEVSQLLQKTVVSTTIQALKDDHELASWIHEGLYLHQAHPKQCLFCEQALSQERVSALQDHFNAEYDRFLEELKGLSSLLTELHSATALSLPHSTEFYEDLAEDYEHARIACLEEIENTKSTLKALIEALANKERRVFENYDLDVIVREANTRVVEQVNAVIQRHNSACDDFTTRVNEARKRFEAHLVATTLNEFNELQLAVKQAKTSLAQAEGTCAQTREDITRLEREIVEHRKPAEELNDDLCNYLGHDEIRLAVKDTGYTITRHNEPAYALSEGERTAIALLYFLKSLQDRNFDLTNGVVALDDPVSSLDANALFIAFGFIRQSTENAAQLFILTHNFAFFRQVKNWFHHLRGQGKKDVNQRPAHFYMLEQLEGANPRCTVIRSLDPLLEQYESEYHYLFARVYRTANTTGSTSLEQHYGLPNVARRLLEMFLAFRRPQVAGELWQKLQDVQFDAAKKVRIVRFVHTHSHGDIVGESEHDLSLLGESRSVLADLLDLIKSEDAQHFAAMESITGLVAVPAKEVEDG